MFTLSELIAIISIVISIVFLFLFLQLHAFENSQRKILFFLILIGLFLLTIDLFVSKGFSEITLYLIPFSYAVIFAIYPLFYIYFRTFVYSNGHISFSNSYEHFVITCSALFILLLYYIPLSNEEKVEFAISKLVYFENITKGNELLIMILYMLYYSQFFFYLYKLSNLIKSLNRDHRKKHFSLRIKSFIKLFVAGTVCYEILLLVVSQRYSIDVYNSYEQLFGFLYLVFIGFLGVNHSKFIIQVKLYQSSKEKKIVPGNNNSINTVSFAEKSEIMRLIQQVIRERKLYLDPNLKLENCARKLHVPARKLSQVIHETYGQSFTKFINDFRINEAVRILNTNKNISFEELGYNVGFNSRSTFNRAFKLHTGLTPREYIIKKTTLTDN